MVLSLSDVFGGVVDGGADPLIGTAAADVAAHGVVDVGVGGRLVRLEQRGGAHDLPALAVAALRHVDLVRLHRFDGGDLLADGGRNRRHARADRLAAQVHGAGAAQSRAATEFGAGHVQVVAQGPQDGRRRIGIDLRVFTVDIQCDHVKLLWTPRWNNY